MFHPGIGIRSLIQLNCIIALALIPFGLTGCGGSVESAEEAETAVAEDAEHDPVSAVEATSDSRFVSRQLVPEGWLDPLAPDEDFFSLPEQEVSVAVQTHAVTETETVRLLGFAEVGSGEDAKKAILKIGEKLVYASPGDEHSGIQVLSIADRSVNLQHGRDRWALSLMDQAIVNRSSEFKMAPGARERNRSTGRSSRSASGQASDFRDSPEFEPDRGSFPGAELPELPQIPDLPNFPDMPELPNLPGLDSLPGFGDLP